ncbi:MAG TPA: murein transglycosylase domain-containing protein [Bacteroidota bacterium]|nr:murein transglycosylase domain-containing protein [Bacteroidota bacterium]
MKPLLAVIALLAIFIGNGASAQDKSEQQQFEEFKKAQKAGVQEQDFAYLNYKAEETARLRKYYDEERKRFREYVAGIQKMWGKKEIDTSTTKRYVGYDSDFKGRRSVDFEKGEGKIEVLIDPNDASDPAKVKKAVETEVVKMIQDKGTDDPLASKSGAVPLAAPILTNQVRTSGGKPVTPENASQFASDVALGSTVHRELVTGSDGKKRVNVSASFPLVPDHVRQRATEFKSMIQNESKRFNLDPRLVFATVHTESYFNPKARSGAPAYGLMQLVPTSGARSAYLFVYKEDKLLTPDYLYQPKNNVELGAGLLNLMMTKDFKDIRDERSRVYCAIAGYNTGPGGVARAFAGKRDIPKAVEMINRMTPEQVFEQLRTRLAFEETRKYIVTVTDKMKLYEEWSRGE